MNIGNGTKWWKFEARITGNVNHNLRQRGLLPTLSQELYAALAKAMAEPTPADVLIALEDFGVLIKNSCAKLKPEVRNGTAT